MFTGSITAMVTPFNRDYTVDIEGFANLIEWQIEHGTNGIAILGTTGEAPTITFEERTEIITRCVEVVNKRVPIIVGTGTNCTNSTLELTEHAKNLGADASLIITPYYNKPNQEGIFQHFNHIATNCTLPIIVYNAPGRSIVDISNDTMARLYRLPNVVGLKDCSGTDDRIAVIKELADYQRHFSFLAGDDPIAVSYNKNGGVGCISVASNLVPARCAQMQELTAKGNYPEANEIQNQLLPLYRALFCDTNPIAIKYALSKTGMIQNTLRLPLLPLTRDNMEKVDEAMHNLGLFYELAS